MSELVVIHHEAVRMADPAVALDYLGKDIEECNTVAILDEDALTGVAATCDVVQGSFVLNPQRPRHDSVSHIEDQE